MTNQSHASCGTSLTDRRWPRISRILPLMMAFLAGMTGLLTATAQEANTAVGTAQNLEAQARLVIPLGSTRIITTSGNIDRVAVSSETKAAVKVLSMNELLVTGKQFGQTTIHIWFEDGKRIFYPVTVGRDLTLLSQVLKRIDPSITATEAPTGDMVLLEGKVATAGMAAAAQAQAERFLAQALQAGATNKADSVVQYVPGVINLISSSTAATADQRLQQALQTIDPRIRARRIQVGEVDDPAADSYILEGRVKSLIELQRALEIADRQLGGKGGEIIALQHEKFKESRGNIGASLGGGGGAGGAGGGGASQALQGSRADSSLATFVSRGLVLTTGGGKVVSFIEVDSIGQILVSIKAMEINRTTARSKGFNYTVSADDFVIGNFTGPFPVGAVAPRNPAISALASAGAGVATGGGSNLVGAYVSDSLGILSAIDLLETNGVGRVVANPNILTLSGEQSSIQVGGQVPVPTSTVSLGGSTQGFFFQNFGIQLDIRATIDDKGVVTLEAQPSITSPDTGLSVEGVPGFKVQQVSTTARVKDGQSLILGGLIQYKEEKRARKVPFLGDVPLIKNAFRWDKKDRSERELLFVITPEVRKNTPNGVQEVFELPSLDSRQNIPVDVTVAPIEHGPEGIPLNWIEAASQYDDVDYLNEEAGANAERYIDKNPAPSPRASHSHSQSNAEPSKRRSLFDMSPRSRRKELQREQEIAAAAVAAAPPVATVPTIPAIPEIAPLGNTVEPAEPRRPNPAALSVAESVEPVERIDQPEPESLFDLFPADRKNDVGNVQGPVTGPVPDPVQDTPPVKTAVEPVAPHPVGLPENEFDASISKLSEIGYGGLGGARVTVGKNGQIAESSVPTRAFKNGPPAPENLLEE